MQANDLSASLNGELGDEVPYRFVAGTRAVAGSPTVLAHADYAVGVHTNGDGYRLTFWWKGREQAHGWTADMPSVARAASSWVRGVGLERLSAAFPFVEFSELQLAYERGRAKEVQWQILLNKSSEGYRGLVELAAGDAALRGLFPQLGHRFVLMRDEYSNEALASVFLIRPGWFAIFQQDGDNAEFEGDAESTVSYLADRIG